MALSLSGDDEDYDSESEQVRAVALFMSACCWGLVVTCGGIAI